MKLVSVNHAFDPALTSPGALLDRYHTLTGWNDACALAGLSVAVVQAFSDDHELHRGAVDYLFCRTSTRPARRAEDMVAAVRGCEPDVVHINGFDAPMLVEALRKGLPPRVALVIQDHAGVFPRRFSPLGLLQQRALRLADAYLFTSPSQAAPWIASGCIRDSASVHGVLEASTRMVPVDRPTALKRTMAGGVPSVLWVGRLDANKDPLTVLAGFEQTLDDLPEATLTMVFGSEVLLAQVTRRLERSRRLRDRVRLVGAVPYEGMADWYSAADLFVLGSHAEACGYALVEACACGTVPVVTDIPPFREVTRNGAIGHHWGVGDAPAFATALRSAAGQADEERRRDVLRHFASHLSWDAVGRRARAIYEDVCVRREQTGRGLTSAC